MGNRASRGASSRDRPYHPGPREETSNAIPEDQQRRVPSGMTRLPTGQIISKKDAHDAGFEVPGYSVASTGTRPCAIWGSPRSEGAAVASTTNDVVA